MNQISTVEEWSGVLTDLSMKQNEAKDHLDSLRKQKQELSLEAALGSSDAKQKLDAINSELGRLVLEFEDYESAIRQAEAARIQAERIEAERVEKIRQSELSSLTETALRQASEFDATLVQLVLVGDSIKTLVNEMLKVATPQESPSIDRLLEFGVWMRAAEHAGLRSFLQFQGYSGDRSHLVPLEESLKTFLSRWIEEGVADAEPAH